MMTRRVVVTGYGVCSPIGNTPEEFWDSLENGKVGIRDISEEYPNAEQVDVHVAGLVWDFPYDKYFQKKDAKRMDKFSLYGIYAALEAQASAGLEITPENEDRVGVIVSSGIGGLQTIQEQVTKMNDRGLSRVAPLFVPISIVNMVAGNVALRLGAKGVCTTVVTACASGTNSIGDAFRDIKHGYSDVIFAGGAEAAISDIGFAGFANLTALTHSTDPARASIPFDKDRSGFVMGNGAGVVVLEELEHAKARGANILAEVVGYGANCDAYHMTSPIPDGSGAAKAMKLAMNEAGIDPSEVGYLNAHGTSTKANEKGESAAIALAFGDAKGNVKVSSTKSLTGHLLGAAGGIEAIASIQALENQFVPATAGTTELDEEVVATGINVVYGEGQPTELEYAMSSSLGFGGHNAVLAFKKWNGE
ncbi:MAG: beta-ketoacyl-ACP synthase II [Lactobacillales bacterium]|nr:beta-ketoacyl-ACP synthase II [Lactobacillales bacterium]